MRLVLRCIVAVLCALAFTEGFTASGMEVPKKITVVMDDNYPPYVFRNDRGRLVGILPELWHLWEKQTGTHVVITAMDWSKALEIMRSGEADVIDTIFKTPEREKVFDFSKPYADIPVSIFYHRSISIHDVSDLKNFVVAVKQGDACVNWLQRTGVHYLNLQPSYAVIMDKAREGEIKVFCMDDPPAFYYLTRLGIADQFMKGPTLYVGQFHRAVRKGHKQLLTFIRYGFSTIPEAKAKAIYARWLSTSSPYSVFVRYAFWVIPCIAVVSLIVGLWIFALRRAVAQKTSALRKLLKEGAMREQLLRTTLYSIGEGIITTDINGLVDRMNNVAESLTGWKEKEARSKPLASILKLVDENGRELTESLISSAMKQGIVYNFSEATFLVSEKGDKCAVAGSFSPVRDEEKNILGVVVVFRDITAELEDRQKLEFAYKLLDLAMEGAGFAVENINVPEGLCYRDRRWAEMVGLESGGVVQSLNSCMEFVHPDDRERVCAAIKANLRGDTETYDEEYRLEHKDGHWIWVKSKGRVIERDSKGDPKWFASVVMDITEQKQSQEKVISLERQLNRVAKLEAVGRLAGGIAHDFNNILQVIFGHAELALAELEPDSPAKSRITQILEVGRRTSNTVRQLLAFARKEAIEPVRLNINGVIEQSVRIIHKLLGEDISLKLELCEDLWDVYMDPGQLDQILMNLLINARDAISGVGTVSIQTSNVIISGGCNILAGHALVSPGEYVRLSVADTGCGIPPSVLERIFEPFFTTKEPGKGTGLGLSVVYGVVRQNGGWIDIKSEVGKGTEVIIYIPRYTGEATKKDLDAFESIGEIQANGRMPKTIIVVEDEESILSAMVEFLKRYGYRVYGFGSPKDAIQWVTAHQNERVDLLIIDVVLPSMSGVKLWEEIRTIMPEAQCLFVTGYGGEILEKYGLTGENVNLLRKPFSMKDLVNKMNSLLSIEQGKGKAR